MSQRVLVYEPIDPTGESLNWLVSQGVQIVQGPPMWQSPYQPLDEAELIEQASGCIALMGGGPNNHWQPRHGRAPGSSLRVQVRHRL